MNAEQLAKKLKNNPMMRDEIAHRLGMEKSKVTRLLTQIRKSPRYELRESDGRVWVQKIRKPGRGMPICIYPQDHRFEMRSKEQKLLRAPKFNSDI